MVEEASYLSGMNRAPKDRRSSTNKNDENVEHQHQTLATKQKQKMKTADYLNERDQMIKSSKRAAKKQCLLLPVTVNINSNNNNNNNNCYMSNLLGEHQGVTTTAPSPPSASSNAANKVLMTRNVNIIEEQ